MGAGRNRRRVRRVPLAGRKLAALALISLLGACVRVIPGQTGSTPPSPVTPDNALAAGVHPGPSVERLGMADGDARLALLSFVESCPRLLSRDDASGLTRQADWRAPCDAAARWTVDPVRFFANYFETVRVGEGEAFATGYFEQEIEGSRQRLPGYEVPVYAMPSDLVRARPGDAPPLDNGRMPMGRYDESGRFVPYYDRAAIEQGALLGKGLEIGWAKDPVEFFFLQIQGSGRLRGPDGSIMRIGYAGQNGQPYTGIGGLMRERGLIGSGPGQYSGSMQGIMQYIRENPEAGRALMRENRSWVFFRELTGDGPIGALGVPVRPKSSVAADPKFVPLGAPVWLDLDRGEADGMWIA
ncbi:MAG: MltA domain-containing protein, partial [Novosphingobium sp.]|nr:MltA domain-containing protein [Novosphingobium sp.]